MKSNPSTMAPLRALLCLCWFMTLVDFAAPASLKARSSNLVPPPMPARALAFGPHDSAVIVIPEVPPKALNCKTAIDCVTLKHTLTQKFCRYNPEYPGCVEM